jgi:PD-(D/E)XK nuclease superfamily
MIYSYTQISQYLTCPRRYRHRYLDGWQEKDTRAAMLFGRAFERALAAFFLHEDAAVALFHWRTAASVSRRTRVAAVPISGFVSDARS